MKPKLALNEEFNNVNTLVKKMSEHINIKTACFSEKQEKSENVMIIFESEKQKIFTFENSIVFWHFCLKND